MQVVLWPAAPHARFSRSRPISIPLSAATFEISLTSAPLKSFSPSEYPSLFPSSNACRQTIPNAESGGESFARLTRRSIDEASVMGLCGDDDVAGAGARDAAGGVGGARITVGDAKGLLVNEVGAGSCFFPFLAIGECCRAK